ncbi:hypothetical protein D9613_006192 [Agrocybe pediades]|uniref:Uncharacterized protein n=1 Tax=Agrocybe pediades TaxID=84607 RepID=A0A8H4QU32_9AGAR|nr:hypothetical protein D9613_006192 [Agrocybe pediades]
MTPPVGTSTMRDEESAPIGNWSMKERQSESLVGGPITQTPNKRSLVANDQASASAPRAMFENANNIIINGGQFIQTFSTSIPNGPSHDKSPQWPPPWLESHNINAIYQHRMSTLRAGTALWIPEGHSNAPEPCQAKGVTIGDVGTLTPSGSFSFLFNICLPANHPVNRNMVPEGFKPIYPEVDPCDIREINEFMPWDYLSTESMRRLANGSDSYSLVSFQIQQEDGAVAVMPEGAISQDLENVSRFRSYAAAHLKEWYRYVNVTRGREIENGDLRLVIGCDKATSWAIAATPKQNHATTIELRAANTLWSTYPPYLWHTSGSVQARVGPPPTSSPPSGTATKAPNQCLFVRTMNLKLGDKEWRALDEKAETPFMGLFSYLRAITSDSEDGDDEWFICPSPHSPVVDPMEFYADAVGPFPQSSPPETFRHASDFLHNIMLSMYPEAKMAITEDDKFLQDFRLPDTDEPTTLRHDQLVNRLKELYEIKYDGGKFYLLAVYLEKKQGPTSPPEDATKDDGNEA